MILLESVTIRNFLSVGNISQTIILNQAPLTLILGANLDIGGENSRNGAGKTTILQAISYALYGEPLTKIKKDNLINLINGGEMFVAIAFQRDGMRYRIERGRKPSILRFLVGDEQRDQAQGERQTLQQIERVVGMTHTMFLHIIALNTFTTPFLKLGTSDQRDVIEELMGISMMSSLAEQLKLQMDENKDDLRDEEAKVKAIGEANARIEAAIVQAERDAAVWQRQHDTAIEQLELHINDLARVDLDAEFAIFDQIDQYRETIRQYNDQTTIIRIKLDPMVGSIQRVLNAIEHVQPKPASSPEISRLQNQARHLREQAAQSIDHQLARLRTQCNLQRADSARRLDEIATLEEDHAVISSQLASPDAHHCSTCGQGLEGTEHLQTVIATLQRKQQAIVQQRNRLLVEAAQYADAADAGEQELGQLQTDHVAQQQNLLSQAEMIEQEIIVVQEALDKQQTLNSEQLVVLQNELQDLQDRQAEHQRDLHAIQHAIRALGSEPRSSYASRDALWRLREERERLASQCASARNTVNPLANKIAGLRETVIPISYDHLNNISDQLKHEQFLYKLLTSKDSFIRKRIIDQNLNYLNKCLNRYLMRLGLPHEVRFLPDLSVEIVLLGRDHDFEQLSRGEMNRVIMATSFSFRDVWESLNTSCNLLLVDECVDQGTDEAGVELALNLLDNIATERQKNVFLISHRENLRSRIDYVLTAEKFEGFTRFRDAA